MPPLALLQNHLGDFLERQIGEAVRRAPKSAATHQQAAAFAHLVAQGLQSFGIQRLRGHIDEIVFRTVTVLPVMRIGRRIAKALQLANRRRKHLGVVFLVHHPIAPTVLLQQARRQPVVAETA